ncbi:MAG: PD40 domain-containing protein [Deltaproteobacteria bacterium]|nr:PD40 domain-containing protein [Deltaproteobacteria bacterium]
MLRTVWALSIATLVFACGSSHLGDDDIDTTGAKLLLDPPSVELTILNGAAVKQGYTATLETATGATYDVTDDVVFYIDSAFGTFAGPVVQVSTAGKTRVTGTFRDVFGEAQLLARVKSVRVDPALPANTPELFDNPEDVARAPNVVYPPDGVVMPRNLGDFETHWTDPTNDIFEVSLKTTYADVRVYVPGNNGNPAAGPRPSFTEFQASEWISAVGVEPSVAYQVRGVQAANPTVVGAGTPRMVTLSNETMEGGLYYWAAASTNNVYGIYRHDMSKPGQPAEEYMTTNQTSGRCVACHVLSKDGSKMAITYDGGNGQGAMVDIATQVAAPAVTTWNFGTFSPDGSRLVTVFNGVITVRNAADQAPIINVPASAYASHPDLSPDGARLVYILASNGGSDWSFTGGRVVVRSYDPITNAFGPETPLVADGTNNFYPSWSPDGEWILFNKAGAGTSSYNNGNASLWVVKADGSQPAIQLSVANIGLGLTNSWGRWAPFEQSIGLGAEKLYWITVSSKRDFGVRLVGAQRPQIWMTPFFPGRAGQGLDPSVPAFRLPFQGIESNNHIAQWTERVVPIK